MDGNRGLPTHSATQHVPPMHAPPVSDFRIAGLQWQRLSVGFGMALQSVSSEEQLSQMAPLCGAPCPVPFHLRPPPPCPPFHSPLWAPHSLLPPPDFPLPGPSTIPASSPLGLPLLCSPGLGSLGPSTSPPLHTPFLGLSSSASPPWAVPTFSAPNTVLSPVPITLPTHVSQPPHIRHAGAPKWGCLALGCAFPCNPSARFD